jgi:hypothetical protein
MAAVHFVNRLVDGVADIFDVFDVAFFGKLLVADADVISRISYADIDTIRGRLAMAGRFFSSPRFFEGHVVEALMRNIRRMFLPSLPA